MQKAPPNSSGASPARPTTGRSRRRPETRLPTSADKRARRRGGAGRTAVRHRRGREHNLQLARALKDASADMTRDAEQQSVKAFNEALVTVNRECCDDSLELKLSSVQALQDGARRLGGHCPRSIAISCCSFSLMSTWYWPRSIQTKLMNRKMCDTETRGIEQQFLPIDYTYVLKKKKHYLEQKLFLLMTYMINILNIVRP